MKTHKCQYCGYTGTRKDVRKHLRKEHGVRGLRRDISEVRQKSELSRRTRTK